MSDTPPPLKRKRGAPLGNKNRLTHGAYARRPRSSAELETSPDRLTLTREISYLRAYIHRVAVLGALVVDTERTLDTLRHLSIAATALTRLIQTEAWLNQAVDTQVQRDGLPEALATLDSFARKVIDYSSTQSPASDAEGVEELDPDLVSILEQAGIDPAILTSALPVYPAPAPKLPVPSPTPGADQPSRAEHPANQ